MELKMIFYFTRSLNKLRQNVIVSIVIQMNAFDQKICICHTRIACLVLSWVSQTLVAFTVEFKHDFAIFDAKDLWQSYLRSRVNFLTVLIAIIEAVALNEIFEANKMLMAKDNMALIEHYLGCSPNYIIGVYILDINIFYSKRCCMERNSRS